MRLDLAQTRALELCGTTKRTDLVEIKSGSGAGAGDSVPSAGLSQRLTDPGHVGC